MKATLHPEEPPRLAALRRYDILDTPNERSFDEIVELAADLCGTPAAQINFIDSDRQWSKAEIGVGVRELPLEVSICAHTILQDGLLEIPDLLEDARTQDNPLCVSAPNARFYAGVPLRSANGMPIGTLCVIDLKPRKLSDTQRHALCVLASQIVAQLDLRATVASAAMLRREIDHRVKNSLQTVSSFVYLERSSSKSEAARSALNSVAQQLNTVALLHEHLSHASGDGHVDLADYLGRVGELLQLATPHAITISGTFETGPITASTAGLLGLIINELVGNSVKHAFPLGAGNIVLTGRKNAYPGYTLTCQDDGQIAVGAAEEINPVAKREGLGLAIIAASVRDLGGTCVSTIDEDGCKTVIDCSVFAKLEDAIGCTPREGCKQDLS